MVTCMFYLVFAWGSHRVDLLVALRPIEYIRPDGVRHPWRVNVHQTMPEFIRKALSGIGGLVVLLTLVACAGPPVQEMSDARQAIQAAEEAGAAKYAPVPLDQARDALASAEEKLHKRAYNGARNDARLAKQKATHARSIAETIGEGR